MLNTFGVGIATSVAEFADGSYGRGPRGAASGADVDVVSLTVGQTFGALARTEWGPSDNWAYYETYNAHQMRFGSYTS